MDPSLYGTKVHRIDFNTAITGRIRGFWAGTEPRSNAYAPASAARYAPANSAFLVQLDDTGTFIWWLVEVVQVVPE